MAANRIHSKIVDVKFTKKYCVLEGWNETQLSLQVVSVKEEQGLNVHTSKEEGSKIGK